MVFADVVVPLLRQFAPDLVLVSAGFDAHARDPLAGMRLTTPAFGAMTSELRRVAEECCEGRMVLVTEGGYDLQAHWANRWWPWSTRLRRIRAIGCVDGRLLVDSPRRGVARLSPPHETALAARFGGTLLRADASGATVGSIFEARVE